MSADAPDQASGLRRLFGKQPTMMIAFASSQRETGRIGDRAKVMMHIAADLVGMGKKVTVFDEHPAPAGIAQAYGLNSRKDFKHVLHGDYPLDQMTLSPAVGLEIIPASRAAGMEFTLADEASLGGNIAMLKSKNDCIMVDCIHRSQQVLSPIARQADQVFAIVPADNDHLMQSYSLVKRIALVRAHPPIAIVMVCAASVRQARATFDKLHRVAFDHLGISLQYQGAAMTPGASRVSLGQTLTQAKRKAPSAMDSNAGLQGFSAHSGIAGSVV